VAALAMTMECAAPERTSRCRRAAARWMARPLCDLLLLSALAALCSVPRAHGAVAAASALVSGGGASAATAARRLRHTLLYPDCMCSCCTVELTLTRSALTGQHEVKCLPPPPFSPGRCMEMCRTRDSIIAVSEEDENGQNLVSYNRFCFLECRPPSCDAPPANDIPCTPITAAQVAEASTRGGNGQEIDTGCYS